MPSVPNHDHLPPPDMDEDERDGLREVLARRAMGVAAESMLPPSDEEPETDRAKRLGGYLDAIKDIADDAGVRNP